MAFFRPTDTGAERVKRVAYTLVFLVTLGWTIPYMFIVPFLRVLATVNMLIIGQPYFLGQDLSTLVPCTAALYYMLTGPVVRRLFIRWPWSRPAVVWAYAATVGTTLMAHGAYLTAGTGRGSLAILAVAALLFLAWRAAMALAFRIWPLERFVAE